MKKTILLATTFTVIYVGCNSVSSGQYTYRASDKINDGKLDEAHIYFAHGWGEQNIMIIPELSAVVVLTGGNYTGTRLHLKFLKNILCLLSRINIMNTSNLHCA